MLFTPPVYVGGAVWLKARGQLQRQVLAALSGWAILKCDLTEDPKT